jgi:hypothetical protein
MDLDWNMYSLTICIFLTRNQTPSVALGRKETKKETKVKKG